jgi:hypothetical protein
MTLDEYVAELKADVERFEKEWRESAAAEPKQYPMAMPPGEWFEQYMAFHSVA